MEEILQFSLVEDAICKEELELLQGQLPVICEGGEGRAAGVKATGHPQINRGATARQSLPAPANPPTSSHTPARVTPARGMNPQQPPFRRDQPPTQLTPHPTEQHPCTGTRLTSKYWGSSSPTGNRQTESTCQAAVSPSHLPSWR